MSCSKDCIGTIILNILILVLLVLYGPSNYRFESVIFQSQPNDTTMSYAMSVVIGILLPPTTYYAGVKQHQPWFVLANNTMQSH